MATATVKKQVLNEEKESEVVIIDDKSLRIPVYLPLLDDDGTGKVCQVESVTINGEEEYRIMRGNTVEVPYSVWFVLQQKYPELRKR